MIVTNVTYTDGIKVHIQGYKFPKKGYPLESAVQATNFVKRLLLFKPFEAIDRAMQPHVLKPEFMTPIARELRRIFPSKFGLILSHIIEYDEAYRLRVQDLCDHTTKEKLLRNPFKEIWKLLKINKKKDQPDVHKKFLRFGLFITIALCTPKIRKAVRNCDFTKLQTDEEDRYWLSERLDYKYGNTA